MNGDPFSGEWRLDPRTGYRLRRYALTDRAYDVAVALPDTPPPPGGFALLVLTDGALHFDAAAGAAAALRRRPEKTRVAPAIVAGIASGADWSHDGDARARALVPGEPDAGALLTLIRERLIPDIAALAPVASGQGAILGHSLGGLFALHALAAAPALFRTAIALSPSLWRLPDLAAQVGQTIGGRGARILLASGEYEPKINADLPAAAEALGQGAEVTRLKLAGEDHGSIPFAALPAALRFLHAAPLRTASTA